MAGSAATFLLLVLLGFGKTHSRELLQGTPAPKVGMWVGLPEPGKDFDNAVRQRVDQLTGMTSTVVPLATLADRLTALENGTVDWVISEFSVTPERANLVDFVEPYYYSAGAALFAPNGSVPGVTSWEDLRGKTVAIEPGYYARDYLASTYGINFVNGSDVPAMEDLVNKGQAVGLIEDSTSLLLPGDFKIVKSLEPQLTDPYAIAVRKGNTQLASKISNAIVQMATGGADSDLAKFEQQYFVANGGAPNPDLADLLKDPKGHTSPLSNGKAAQAAG